MGRELQPRRATAPHLRRVISHHLIGHVRLAATMLVAFSQQDLKREGRREREERKEEGGEAREGGVCGGVAGAASVAHAGGGLEAGGSRHLGASDTGAYMH